MVSDLVSVIVPIYNLEQYIDKCVHSILAQTYRKLEILLIDDGSSDKSGEICERYASEDERISVFHNGNGGLSAARNFGIEHSRGEYLCFIDGDDDVQPCYVERLYRLCVENECEIAICDYYREDISAAYDADGGLKLTEHKQENISESVYPARELVEKFHTSAHRIAGVAWNKLYHRSVIGDVRYPEGLIYEDECTTVLYIYNASRVAYTSEQLYCYRKRDGSIMQRGFSLDNLQKLKGYDIRKSYFAERGEAGLVATEEKCYMSALLAYYYRLLKYLPEEKFERKKLLGEYRRCYREYEKQGWGLKMRFFYFASYFFPLLYGLIKKL